MSQHIHYKYLTVTSQDALWGLAVNTVGTQEIGPGEPYPPSSHPQRYLFSEERGRILSEYQLIYISQGSGRFISTTLGHWVNLSEGDLFILFPGEWHSYRPDPKTGWKEYWIGFNGSFMKRQEENGLFTRDKAVMHVGIHSKMTELYENAITVAAEQKSSFQSLLGALVMHMLGLGYYYAKQEGFSEVEERIDRAKMIIQENLPTVTPEEIASKLCMGYSNFRRIFKQYTGFSPAKYITQMRINRILEALTNTYEPIKQIAFENGFDNYDYFFTVFRRIAGTTPGEYRALTQRGGIKP